MSFHHVRLALLTTDFAGYLEGGGHWSWFLQYALGLRDLGVQFYWLDLLAAADAANLDRIRIDAFLARAGAYGLRNRCRLVVDDRGSLVDALAGRFPEYDRSPSVAEIVASADAVWCFAARFSPDIVGNFHRRVLLDLDPGHVQVAATQLGDAFDQYDVHLTVGQNVGREDCPVPTLGKHWERFMPAVHMRSWPHSTIAPDGACLSSITHWNWGEVCFGDRVLSTSKREAYLRYLSLPARVGRSCELAAHVCDVPEAGDRALLLEHGWRIADPWAVAGTVETYRAYVQQSYAEFCCPKPVFRELSTGWCSDRSAVYLASGRPVLMEDTGLSSTMPGGAGLLYFTDIDSAVDGVRRLEADYAAHSAAARGLAEDHFSSARVLPRLLELTLNA